MLITDHKLHIGHRLNELVIHLGVYSAFTHLQLG